MQVNQVTAVIIKRQHAVKPHTNQNGMQTMQIEPSIRLFMNCWLQGEDFKTLGEHEELE